ncbi:673_t:CDS:2 [Entrophospora sp. SA101]|nr:673_t:CDS:2 [Entrophospora sp. SA101]CAJ0923950.1 22099_t:CDS:2 [Entrophospora sp. SA101]
MWKNNNRITSLTIVFFILTFSLIRTSSALYFYLEGNDPKCFNEELPKDILVVGTYKAEEWSDTQQQYIENTQLGIQIIVEELPHNHRIVNQRGANKGRFTFTTAEAGDHIICLQTNSSNWFSSTQTKLHLDIVFGDSTDSEDNHEHFSDLAQRVHDLNYRVTDIRREQSYQREREAEFRDQSELTNSRVLYWTVIQLIVLGITCLWQMTHLKNFFEAKKLV